MFRQECSVVVAAQSRSHREFGMFNFVFLLFSEIGRAKYPFSETASHGGEAAANTR